MGRRSKMTPERVDLLLRMIAQGVPHCAAAGAIGINECTFYRWRQRGAEAESGKYADFYARLEVAEAQAEASLTLLMRSHAHEPGAAGVRATQILLQARWPERWAPKPRVVENRIQGHDGGPAPANLAVNIAALTGPQLAALAQHDLGELGDELEVDDMANDADTED